MEMEGRIKLSKIGTAAILMLLMMISDQVALPSLACSSDTSNCGQCIANRMKFNCPGCVYIMRCMAKCLWGGTSRTKCIKKCDCNSDYPKLADCKKCLSHCQCSCSA